MTTRSYNRTAETLRPLRITPNIQKDADGSLLFEIGETKIICSATVADGEVPEFLRNKGSGWITAEYALLPASTSTRVVRERQKVSGRTSEIQRLIGRSLRSVTDLKLLGPRTVTVDCDVLQADGGTRCAAISAGYLALHFALRNSMKRGHLKEMPLKRRVAAISVGMQTDQILLDLDYEEDARCSVDCNIVMDDAFHLIEIQGTGEKHSFSRNNLNRMLDLAEIGIREILDFQEAYLS